MMRTFRKFLALALLLSLIPASIGASFAADESEVIDVSDSTVPGGVGWIYADGVFTVKGNVTITGTTAVNRVVVAPGTVADITLSGVNIDRSRDESREAGACAFDLSNATVNLLLQGDNRLASGLGYAGLQAPKGAMLTIGGEGSLRVNGGGVVDGGMLGIHSKMSFAGAGIGGGALQPNGVITINSGTVIAIGGLGIAGGAGIGSGAGAAGNDGCITITGGTIEARGADGAAGIGGGEASAGGTIVISGGNVTAVGGSADSGARCGGAGIGGGAGGDSHFKAGDFGTITITGSANVNATGGNGAAYVYPIGGGGAGGAGVGSGDTGSAGGGIDGSITINNIGLGAFSSGVGPNGRIGAVTGVGTGGRASGAGISIFPKTEVIYRSVRITQTAGGTIVPLGGDADTIAHGASKTFVFTPDPGNIIAFVIVDGVRIGAVTSRTFPNITTDSHHITAVFFDGVTASLRGDANCDNAVSAADAAAILRHLVRLETLNPLGLVNAKVTSGTGDVSAADAAKILRFLVRLETEL